MKRKGKGERKHIRNTKSRKRQEYQKGRYGLLMLTELQRKVLETIIEYIEQKNKPPSLRELGIVLFRHFTQMQDVVSALAAKGLLLKDNSGNIHLNPERYEVKVLKEKHVDGRHVAKSQLHNTKE